MAANGITAVVRSRARPEGSAQAFDRGSSAGAVEPALGARRQIFYGHELKNPHLSPTLRRLNPWFHRSHLRHLCPVTTTVSVYSSGCVNVMSVTRDCGQAGAIGRMRCLVSRGRNTPEGRACTSTRSGRTMWPYGPGSAPRREEITGRKTRRPPDFSYS